MRKRTAPLLLVLFTACSSGGAGPHAVSRAPTEALQAQTAYLTQEVDGTPETRQHWVKVHGLARQVGALILAETKDSLHLRLPADQLDAMEQGLAALAPITQRTLAAPEVTGLVMDLRVRVESQTALRARLIALLERADTIEEVLAVERELGRVTEALALIEAQLQAQESEVALAELHLTVEDPAHPGPVGWIFYGLYRGVKWLFVWD